MGLICYLLGIYFLVVIVRIVLSWFPIARGSPVEGVASFLYLITEPVLGPVRRALPPVRLGGIALDISPILVLLAISLLQRSLC